MDLQIDDFHEDTASGFLFFYRAFPRKTTPYAEDPIGREVSDEFGLPSKRHQSCLSVLLWLAKEDYLRFANTIRYEALDQAVLSEKVFLRLTHIVPRAVTTLAEAPTGVRREQASLANQLRQAPVQGDGERLAGLTRLLSEGNLDAQDDIAWNSPSIEPPWIAPCITPHDYQGPVRPPRRLTDHAPCLQL